MSRDTKETLCCLGVFVIATIVVYFALTLHVRVKQTVDAFSKDPKGVMIIESIPLHEAEERVRYGEWYWVGSYGGGKSSRAIFKEGH